MKVALLGDVHANLPALEAVLADARRRGAEAVWDVGDSVGYGAFPNQVVRTLREAGAVSILGNYDRKVLDFPDKKARWEKKKDRRKFLAFRWAYEQLSVDNRRYLRSLPEQRRLRVAGRRILLVHGSPACPNEAVSPDTPADRLAELAFAAQADLVICGHSHRPLSRRIGGVRFINTGSVGRPEGGDPRAGYAMLNLRPSRVIVRHHRVEYDVERAAEAIRENGLPEAFAQMILQGDSLDGIVVAGGDGEVDQTSDEDVLAAVLALAEQCHYEREHTQQVAELADKLFQRLQMLHGLGEQQRLWLRYGALLHDIGWMEGQQRHHKTALRVILSAKSLPFDMRVRHIVASIARYHRKALPNPGHTHLAALGEADRKIVSVLAGILRIADGLDRTHTCAVRDVACEITADRVLVKCSVSDPAEMEMAAATKKSDLFQQAFGRDVEFEAVGL